MIPEPTTRLAELQTGNVDIHPPSPSTRSRCAPGAAGPVRARGEALLRLHRLQPRGASRPSPTRRSGARWAWRSTPQAIIRALQMEEFAVPAGGPYAPIFRDLYDPRDRRRSPRPRGARILAAKGWVDARADGILRNAAGAAPSASRCDQRREPAAGGRHADHPAAVAPDRRRRAAPDDGDEHLLRAPPRELRGDALGVAGRRSRPISARRGGREPLQLRLLPQPAGERPDGPGAPAADRRGRGTILATGRGRGSSRTSRTPGSTSSTRWSGRRAGSGDEDQYAQVRTRTCGSGGFRARARGHGRARHGGVR
jgi:hypothetical protein